MKNRRRFFLFFFLSLFLLTLTSFMTLARAGFHGDVNSGIDIVLGNSTTTFNKYFPTYSSTNDIVYNSHDLRNFNLPLIFKYNGTLTQPTLVVAFTDITATLNKIIGSDDISINAVLFLVNQSYTVPNITSTCSRIINWNNTVNATPNCTTTNNLITKWKWTWIPLTTVILTKEQWYAVDLAGSRSANTKSNAVDITPRLLGFPINEFAWWNSSFSSCRNLNLNQAYFNYTIGMNLSFSGAKSDWGDLRFVDQTCNNGGNILPYWFESNSTSWVQTWVYTGGQSLSALSVYYGDSNSNYIGNGFNTFTIFDNCNGASLNSSVWGSDDVGTTTVSGGYCRFGTNQHIYSLTQEDRNSEVVASMNQTAGGQYGGFGYGRVAVDGGNNLIIMRDTGTVGQLALSVFNAVGTPTDTNIGAVNDFGGPALFRFELVRNDSLSYNSAIINNTFRVKDSVTVQIPNWKPIQIMTESVTNTWVDWIWARNYTSPDASVTVGALQSLTFPPTFDNGSLNTTYQNTTLISNNNTGYNNLGNISFSRNVTNNNANSLDTITFMFGGNITTQNYTNKNAFNGIQVLNKTVQGIFYLNLTFPNLTSGNFWYIWSANTSAGDYNQTGNYTLTILLVGAPPPPPPPTTSTSGLSATYCADDNSTIVMFRNITYINAQGNYYNATNETQRCPYGCDASLNICDPPPYLIYLYIALLTFITIVFVFVIKRLANR